LRLILLGITGRPVLSHPTPQREYDLLTLPSSLLRAASPASPPSGSAAGEAAPPSAAVTPSLPPFAPLRSHLFPITTALPESHLAHPTSLLPTLSPGQAVAEVIESSLTLIHVILLLRAAVSLVRFVIPPFPFSRSCTPVCRLATRAHLRINGQEA